MKIFKTSTLLFITVIILAVLLSACGAADGSASITTEETVEVSGSATPPVKTANGNSNVPSVSGSSEDNAEAQESEALTLAKSFIGRELSDFVDEFGEPESSLYASSCLGEGEDGELIYSDFIVYTYKENDSETIQDVQ